MRNRNEETRNGNEEMRLSMGKVVHASQKLACCIDICCEKSWQNINLTFHTNFEPYDRLETEVD